MSSTQSPKKRPTATERRAQQAKNPYSTVSARERRAREQATTGTAIPTADVKSIALTTAQISELLDNPTKTVSEAEMRAQYAYVLKDLRSMGVLTAALFALLIALAFLFPQIGI
jgi:hypothetical protein